MLIIYDRFLLCCPVLKFVNVAQITKTQKTEKPCLINEEFEVFFFVEYRIIIVYIFNINYSLFDIYVKYELTLETIYI